MRLLFLFLAVQIISVPIEAQKSFQVKGYVLEPSAPVKVFLSLQYGKWQDSAVLKDGKFSFKGKYNLPVKAMMYTQEINSKETYPKREYLYFYLEEGTTVINGFKSIKDAVVRGGAVQKEYSELQDSLQRVQTAFNSISALLRSREVDDTAKMRLRNSYKSLNKLSETIENAFIKSHPASVVSWDIVDDRGIIINPDELEPVFYSLAQEFQERPAGIELKRRIEIAKKLNIGNPAFEFSSDDTLGKSVSLSSFKGKYVLIDFWASWCGPCRAENPNMLRAYKQLKGKNFEIFGVSLDDKRDKWIKAINEDKLPWVQVSDLKGFNTVAKTYDIRAIPQNYLLNPEGKIIAKNIRGVKLLEEVMSKMGL